MATHDDAVLAAFEQADELIVVFDGDDLVVRAANAAARGLLGDVTGRSATDVLGDEGPHQLMDVVAEVAHTRRPRLLTEWRVQMLGPSGEPDQHTYTFQVQPWLHGDGQVAGVLLRGRESGAEARARQRVERRAGSALAVVRTLQDVLLPEDLPVLPGLHIDSSYLLAAEQTDAGGDWYDALVRPSGRVVLAAGDVVGHGAAAWAAMGQLRAVLHDRLLDDIPLAEVVEAAERHTAVRDAVRTVTLVLVELDLTTGRFDYVTAGHPRPLVVGVDGEADFLPPSGAGPLGTGSAFEVGTAELREGEMIVLYTDGAVERPERTPRQASQELAAIATDTYLDRSLGTRASDRATERVCRTGLELLARRTGHRDDITVLAAQRVPVLEPLSLRMQAEPQSVASCRLELAPWLDRAGARSLDAIALQHAVGELVDNVVQHAYGDALAARLDDSAIAVDAALLPSGEVAISVSDLGTWQVPAPGHHGRGLAMARGFMDKMRVERREAGTTVELRHRLTRPARLNTSYGVDSPAPGPRFGVDVDRDAVSVRGDVDARSADELRVTLDRATHGRTSPVTVDLTDVTHLGGTGVQVLFELLRDDPEVDLVAREGSLADHVLDVVQLSHAT